MSKQTNKEAMEAAETVCLYRREDGHVSKFHDCQQCTRIATALDAFAAKAVEAERSRLQRVTAQMMQDRTARDIELHRIESKP